MFNSQLICCWSLCNQQIILSLFNWKSKYIYTETHSATTTTHKHVQVAPAEKECSPSKTTSSLFCSFPPSLPSLYSFCPQNRIEWETRSCCDTTRGSRGTRGETWCFLGFFEQVDHLSLSYISEEKKERNKDRQLNKNTVQTNRHSARYKIKRERDKAWPKYKHLIGQT